MSEQSRAQRFADTAQRLQGLSDDPDLGATLEVAGEILESGDAGTAARMLLDRGDANLDASTWQEVVSALVAELEARDEQAAETAVRQRAEQRGSTTSSDRAAGAGEDDEAPGGGQERPDGGQEAPGGGQQRLDGGQEAPGGGEQRPDGGQEAPGGGEDPLVAALQTFAAELEAVAASRAEGHLDARETLQRVKQGFHATRRTLSAAQRDEVRSRAQRR